MATHTSLDGASAPKLLRLDMGHNRNWDLDAGPVAVLNEASTLHERVAYCWGLAQQLVELSAMLSESTDEGVASAASLYYNQLTPLANMLDHLGDCTRPNLAADTFNPRSPV